MFQFQIYIASQTSSGGIFLVLLFATVDFFESDIKNKGRRRTILEPRKRYDNDITQHSWESAVNLRTTICIFNKSKI